MPFQFDVYLIGPSSGVDATHLRAGMVRLFGQLPDEFLRSIGHVPLRIKSGVDLDVAQTFVDSIKAAGGVVELVQAGSPAPGHPAPSPVPSATGPTPIATAGSYRSAQRAGAGASAPDAGNFPPSRGPRVTGPQQTRREPPPQPEDDFLAPAYDPASSAPAHAAEPGYDPFGYGAQTNTPDYGMFSADNNAPLPETNPWESPGAAPDPNAIPTFAQSGMDELDLDRADTDDFGVGHGRPAGGGGGLDDLALGSDGGLDDLALGSDGGLDDLALGGGGGPSLDNGGYDGGPSLDDGGYDGGLSLDDDGLGDVPLDTGASPHAPAPVPPTRMPMDDFMSTSHDGGGGGGMYDEPADNSFLTGNEYDQPYSADMQDMQDIPSDDLPLDLDDGRGYGGAPDMGAAQDGPGLGVDPAFYNQAPETLPIDDPAMSTSAGIPGGATPWQDPAVQVAPAAYDPAAPIPAATAETTPVVATLSGDIEKNLVSLEVIPPTHPLRDAANAVVLQPIGSMQEIIGALHKDLRLGVLGERDLDKMVAQYLQQRLQLDEAVRLYVTEPRDEQHAGAEKKVTGVVITDRSLAWRQAKIPLRRIEAVAVQSDLHERAYVEIVAAGDTFKLPLLKPFSTLLLAETLARLSPGRRLWVLPRAAANLRRGMSSLLSKMTKTSLTRGTSGVHSRKAMSHVRHYYNLLQERLRFWETWRLEQRGMGVKMIQMADILDIVTAPEFHEIRDKLGEDTQHLALEMLVSAQNVLADNEGVIALFELRERDWDLPPDARRSPQRTAAYMVLRAGALSNTAERASDENYLLGTHGVLSQERLMFLRPGGGVALDIKLGRIDEIKVSNEPMPTLTIKYLGAFDERLGLKYKTSGNYLYPVMGTPKQQVERLADRITDAQERFWELSQQGLPETTRLPPHPNWLSEAIQREPPERIARMNLVVVELMRDRTTPREVRRLAQVTSGIKLVDLKAMRKRLDEQGVGLGGVGERVCFLPGELFEDPDDGLLVCENGLIVAGVGSGRCGWNEIYRFEHINEGRWHSALIGNRGGDIALRTRDEKFVHFVGLLISSLVYAVNSTG